MPTDTTMLTIKEAVLRIKNAILQSQQQTVQNINVNVLSLYYSIGEFISRNTRRQQWGSGAIKTISEQLQKELPGLRGYSETNLKNMRLFYEGWCCYIIRQPAADELPLDDSKKNRQPTADDSENMLVIVGGLQFTSSAFSFNIAHDFLSISFTHHMEILSKTNTLDERLFYIQQTSNYKWDKYKLREALKQDCYHHRGAMPNNFLQTLPQRLQALKAIEMFKDEYFLDYLNTEELGVRDLEDIDERVVEQSIVHNIKNFIMTFGTDFTFVGNQYHLEKFGKAHFVDLLFYNRELACLVAVELKMGEFKPMYLGQLQTYLQLLDDKVRKPN
ncbi:MAG: PDDEXK nuclease domain-containing protein, partial [Paludibacteraceae bacterium]